MTLLHFSLLEHLLTLWLFQRHSIPLLLMSLTTTWSFPQYQNSLATSRSRPVALHMRHLIKSIPVYSVIIMLHTMKEERCHVGIIYFELGQYESSGLHMLIEVYRNNHRIPGVKESIYPGQMCAEFSLRD